MSGSDARRGFRYQDLYLLGRILPYLRNVFRMVWRAGGHEVFSALDASPLRFGIETKASNAPADGEDATWDLTIADGQEEEIIEAKSGAVQRADRLVFWERLRKTVGLRVDQSLRLVPVLVVDPEAESMDKWRGLALAAQNFIGPAPSAPPGCAGA